MSDIYGSSTPPGFPPTGTPTPPSGPDLGWLFRALGLGRGSAAAMPGGAVMPPDMPGGPNMQVPPALPIVLPGQSHLPAQAQVTPPTAAPSTAPAPPYTGPTPGIPRVPEKAERSERQFNIPAGPEPAKPGELPPAPQQAQTPPTDFSSYKALMEEGKPEESERLGAVLGGLAKGVSEVRANEPGSFARALAAWGAGGMSGLQAQHGLEREYAQKRAGAELNMLNIQHNQDLQRAEVGFQNAKSVYDRDTKNQLVQQEYEEKKAERLQPKVHVGPDGVTTSAVNPDTGQMEIHTFPTRDVLDKADKLMESLKAMNVNTPEAEIAAFNYAQREYANQPPEVRQAALSQLAVRRVIMSGAGSQVFGKNYQTVVEAVKKEMEAEGGSMMAATKPLEYQDQLLKRVAARFAAHPQTRTADFYNKAAPHSMAACILSGSKTCMPPEAARPE